MRLSEAVQILARRLGKKPGRVAALANRLQHAAMLPMADARRTPPEISHGDMATLLIVALADNGLHHAAEVARAHAGLAHAVERALQGAGAIGDLIIREGGSTAVIDGCHTVFGQPAEDGKAAIVTRATMAAIAAEFHGAPPHIADAAAALQRI